MKYPKPRIAWAGALALAVTLASQFPVLGQTNGTIMIITRFAQDLSWLGEDGDPNDADPFQMYKAAGQCSPGDVAMAELLGDYGYVTRMVIGQEVFLGKQNPYTGVLVDELRLSDYLDSPVNPDFKVCLIIQSGSGSSSYAPPLGTNGIPVMSGEHACLSDRSRAGSLFMYYNGGQSGDLYGPPNGGDASQYMYVLAPNHPIMQGIPLDEQGRVKVIRDPYPEESAHIPAFGVPNYEYDYPVQWVSNAAPATTVLGVVDNYRQRSCFAVADVGGTLSNGKTATVRLVHFFVCEGGGNDSRRCFNALTDLGRVIFVRAAKWAMGETLQPYNALKIKDVSVIEPGKRIALSWESSADKNYKILGTENLFGPANFANWQTIVQDIPGTGGLVSRTLDISGAPQVAFLRVVPAP